MGIPNLVMGAVQVADNIGLQIANLISSTGCGQACTTASAIANSASTMCQLISQRYFSLPAPRTAAQQAAALADMDAVANWAIAQCNNPALGDAGQRCVSERFIQGNPAPWCPNPNHTGCDFVTACRVPIANDSVVPGGGTVSLPGGQVPLPAQTVGGAYVTPTLPTVAGTGPYVSTGPTSVISPGGMTVNGTSNIFGMSLTGPQVLMLGGAVLLLILAFV